jgi:hypothetical protein
MAQKQIEAREGRPLDVLEAHWNQMKVVLQKETKIEQAILMTKAWANVKSGQRTRW